MVRRTGSTPARGVIAGVLVALAALTAPAHAAPPAVDTEQGFGIWTLFAASFDLFTVLLVLGSLAAVWLIVKCIIEIRPASISSKKTSARIARLIDEGNFAELRRLVDTDTALASVIVREAIGQSARGRDAMRDAAEVAASVECSRWFRKIEPLNIIGNLGPLIGLAGTVWGMIIAFNALGDQGGQAGPAVLSEGISKALFHTLLGLMLAIPCLLVFGLYRGVVDRICNRAMADAARFVERLPADEAAPAPAARPPERMRA